MASPAKLLFIPETLYLMFFFSGAPRKVFGRISPESLHFPSATAAA